MAAGSATLAASAARRHLSPTSQLLCPILSLLAAFAAYEVALFVLAVSLLGGEDAFSLPVVSRILVINILAQFGLLLLHRVVVVNGAGIGSMNFTAGPRLA
jgi:hypothetical protein